jgi:hypothetical protein
MSKKGNMDVREKARVSSSHGDSMTTPDLGSRSSRGDRFPSGAAGVGEGVAVAAHSAAPARALRVRSGTPRCAEGRSRASEGPQEPGGLCTGWENCGRGSLWAGRPVGGAVCGRDLTLVLLIRSSSCSVLGSVTGPREPAREQSTYPQRLRLRVRFLSAN